MFAADPVSKYRRGGSRVDVHLQPAGAVMARSCRIGLRVEFRAAAEEDLEPLEWFGEYSDQRQLIRDAFACQQRGELLMLLATVSGFPVGQIWIDLDRDPDRQVAMLYALRVLFLFQRSGIGRVLVRAAEAEVRKRGFAIAEIGAEKDNPRARELYERIGYSLVGERIDPLTYYKPDGEQVETVVDQWILQRRLRRE